jgi:hypothetical protein
MIRARIIAQMVYEIKSTSASSNYPTDYQKVARSCLGYVNEYLDNELHKCLSVKDGYCDMWWRHDECARLMNILFQLTENRQYEIQANI